MKATKIIQINEMARELAEVEISETDQKVYDIVYKIIQTRKKQNLTQKQLSEITGLSHNTISRIETYLSTPSLPVLINIADALNLNLTLQAKEN